MPRHRQVIACILILMLIPLMGQMGPCVGEPADDVAAFLRSDREFVNLVASDGGSEQNGVFVSPGDTIVFGGPDGVDGTIDIAQAPLAGPGIAVLSPGDTFMFGEPDGVDGTKDFSGPGIAVLGTDIPLPLDSPLSSLVAASGRLSRATTEILRFNDFTLDATWDSETMLEGRITGTVDVRGFILLIGVGQVKVEVLAELLDVTDPEDPIVVNCKTLSKHQVKSALKPSLDVSLKLEGGAPYIGGGLGIGTGNLIHLELLKVRDSVDFGFDVMLRRGHTYRLIVKNKTEGTLTVAGLGLGFSPLGGKAIASFFDPAALVNNADVLIPNIIEDFMDRLLEIVENLKITTTGPRVNIPLFKLFDNKGECDGGDNDGDECITDADCDSNDCKGSLFREIFNSLGWEIKTQGDSIRDLLEDRFGIDFGTAPGEDPTLCHLVDKFFDLADMLLDEEQIDTPGVTTRRLCVSIEQDQIELAERQRIEDGIDSCQPIVAHVLPAEFGGQLEKVFLLVDERITQTENAGLPTGQARSKFNQAEQARAGGSYKNAHMRLCQAYHQLLNGGGN